jgi:hypothetical protein
MLCFGVHAWPALYSSSVPPTPTSQVLLSPEFAHSFRVVVFPIYEDANSTSAINPRGCGLPFADAFGAKLLSFPE